MKRVVIYLLLFTIFSGIITFFHVFPTPYYSTINTVSKKYNVDKATIYTIIKIESNFREKVISHKGAIGLMQIMPTTGEWVAMTNNIDFKEEMLLDPEYNIKIGTLYLSYFLNRYGNNMEDVLVSYNAGPSRLTDGSWKNFKETKNYLIKFKIVNFFYKIRLYFI